MELRYLHHKIRPERSNSICAGRVFFGSSQRILSENNVNSEYIWSGVFRCVMKNLGEIWNCSPAFRVCLSCFLTTLGICYSCPEISESITKSHAISSPYNSCMLCIIISYVTMYRNHLHSRLIRTSQNEPRLSRPSRCISVSLFFPCDTEAILVK